MSSIATLYLMKGTDFHEYCKLAGLQPTDSLPTLNPDDKSVVVYAGSMRASDVSREPRFEEARKSFDFLQSHSSKPFQFYWSGYALYELLDLLKDEKQIDLMSKSFAKSRVEEPDYLLDASVKEKYLVSLDPAHFSEKQLEIDYQHRTERLKEEYLQEMASKLSLFACGDRGAYQITGAICPKKRPN